MTWYRIFPGILNMSLTASVIIIFVLLARVLLKKVPKIYSYALWSVVLFRLLCPLSVSASVSILGILDAPVTESRENFNTVEYIPYNIVHEEYPEVNLPLPGVNDLINENLPQGEEQLAADPLEFPITMVTYIWLLGIAVMMGYSLVLYFGLRSKLAEAVPLYDNIYLADHISSSFVIGIIRPRIYVSSSLEDKEKEYIILHEKHHIHRMDHIVKALAFLAFCIHWFNPLVWAAFHFSTKDMEMSCDEAVIKKMGEEIRADYSASLLRIATRQRQVFGTPLAFGDGDVKGRIHNLAKWKKPRRIVAIGAVLVCVAAILVSLFNPKEKPLQVQELSCRVVCDGQESYIEPEYYPEGFDFDYEKLIYAEVRDSGKLIFDVSWDTNTLIVSEDYYHYDVTSSLAGRVERNTYELQANEEGGFELEVAHRNKVRDEQAVYFIQGEKGVFAMEVLFLASEKTPSAVVEPALEKEITEDHVLKEINAVVDGNRTLTMKAIGKKREDMDLWGICQIDVYEGSTKIQVIHLKDIIDIDGLDGSVDQGYTECWSKEELLQVKDVNFDGNQDMEIFAWITNTSIPYYYMLWNGNSGQFEYGFRIQLTEVDYDKQQLIASYGEGAGTYYTDYYRYNENGELYLADVEIKDGEGNLINRQEQEWVEITEEEKLGNGQYLADMDWESLKTRITDTEYQAVQKYLSVLEGDDFTWIYRSGEGREPDTYIHDKKRISIEKWIQESYERNEQQPQKPVINSFVFADVFQSGQENICILFRHLGFHWLILHEEEGVIYGIDMPVRWFGGVQKDGLYYSSGGAADSHYKRMTFENGEYTEHEIAHISYDELYQNGEKKSAEDLAEWEKENIKEPAQIYYPKEE